MNMAIYPGPNDVLVKKIEKETFGIIVSDEEKEKSGVSQLVKYGNKVKMFKGFDFDMIKKVRVIHSMYDGLPVKHEGVEYLILRDSEVRGILEEI